MAFDPPNAALPDGKLLREGLDALRFARYRLAAEFGKIVQMSNAQVEAFYGHTDGEFARNELLSGIGNFLANDAGVSSATQTAAVAQMLNIFG